MPYHRLREKATVQTPELAGQLNLSDLKMLAKGGRSTIYSGRRTEDGRAVALKIFDDPATGVQQREILSHHAAAVASLRHPNIARIYGTGLTGDARFYYHRDLLDRSIADMAKLVPVPVRQATELGAAIADALWLAHESKIFHGAVDPSNIFYRKDVSVLANFQPPPASGFAASRRDLRFDPPEFMWSLPPSAASDVFQLCATIGWLILGRPVRDVRHGVSLAELQDVYAAFSPAWPNMDHLLVEVLRSGLQFEPANRLGMDELRQALTNASKRAQARRIPTEESSEVVVPAAHAASRAAHSGDLVAGQSTDTPATSGDDPSVSGHPTVSSLMNPALTTTHEVQAASPDHRDPPPVRPSAQPLINTNLAGNPTTVNSPAVEHTAVAALRPAGSAVASPANDGKTPSRLARSEVDARRIATRAKLLGAVVVAVATIAFVAIILSVVSRPIEGGRIAATARDHRLGPTESAFPSRGQRYSSPTPRLLLEPTTVTTSSVAAPSSPSPSKVRRKTVSPAQQPKRSSLIVLRKGTASSCPVTNDPVTTCRVKQLYTVVLGRRYTEEDQTAAESWAALPSVEAVRRGLAYSLEAKSRISDFYHACLGRAPEPSGLASWQRLLGTGTSMYSVAQQIRSSPESRSKGTPCRIEGLS
ncbi:protein kinase domain-containing protein [Actinoplanes sp. CA-030573]|uniref:protein kinase domain-containing protein n=1 Tax=Actinoplanes sp. CA-030573 TaxID=3239898 RepID=UPI003D8D2A2C